MSGSERSQSRAILGISDSHNSSASLLVDGRLVAALQEERPSRKKNFWGMPVNAIRTVLKLGGLDWQDLDAMVLCEHRQAAHQEFGREEQMEFVKQLVESNLVDSLGAGNSVSPARTLWRQFYAFLRQSFPQRFYRLEAQRMTKQRTELLHRLIPESREQEVQYIDHHACHFATALFGSGPADHERLVFTYDFQGDGRCGSVTRVRPDGTREVLSSIEDRDSVCQLWTLLTLLCGFVPNEHEYKLMGMAPYASPYRSAQVAEELAALFSWNRNHHEIWNRREFHLSSFHALVRKVKNLCKFRRFDDICGGLQMFTEQVLTHWICHWVKKTGVRDVCLSGGVFMNVKANLEIMKCDEIDSVFVFPSCGDETNAIGAGYLTYFDRSGLFPEALQHLFLGPEWDDVAVSGAIQAIDRDGLEITRCPNIEGKVAELLADNRIVARFKGREEFGARALGNRSILAHPGRWSTVGEINDMIKKRDFWMPFACSVLYEDQSRYIQNPKRNGGEYMIMAFEGGPEVDSILAGCHPRDKTVRAQVVRKEQSPEYHFLMERFKERTGLGAVLNTSFNLHGYPLVHTPQDALHVFRNSGLQYLALGDYLISKNGKPKNRGDWVVSETTIQRS